MTPAAAALALARSGVPVFPCGADKRPLIATGFKAASSDLAQVTGWWREWPLALIGVPTGSPSGLWVADLDVDKDTGEAICASSVAALGIGAPLHVARTRSGGAHWLYRWHEGLPGNTAKRLPGVDTRGAGGFIIVWDATTVLDALGDPCTTEPPGVLLEALARPAPEMNGAAYAFRPGDASAWAEKALAEEAGDVAGTAEGSRNARLNVAAFRLGQIVGGGHLDQGRVEAELAAAAAAAGLPPDEAEATIRSGMIAGGDHPRGPKASDGSQPKARATGNGGDPGPQPGDPGPQPDETNARVSTIEPTEHGVATAFTTLYADRFRYDYDVGSWFEWTGDHWRQDASGRAFHACCELAHSASAGPKPSASVRRASFAAGAERIARAHPAHIIGQSAWDRDPLLLGCPGATVNLRTGTSRAPDQADRITKLAACAPAPSADCPRWLAFLKEATGKDEGLIRFLQQWCGYCLTGITREHAFVFIWGDGGRGKGTFLNTVAAILGNYATTAAMELLTATKFDRHPTELAALRGARLVTASETEKGRAWADARLKALTGGDPIKARFMRQDEFEYLPQLKLTLMGNHRPSLDSVDDAIRRRLNMVAFDRKPATVDVELPDKLKAEWASILRWMIDGCLNWQANGLVRPACVLAATAEYFDAQDSIGQWLEECCIVEKGNLHRWETAADLFASWRDFAKARGEEPGTAKGLGDALRSHGFTRGTKRVGKTTKVWCGINLILPELREP